MELKVEYVPIKSIKPYKRNAKLHPDEQIEQIKHSIETLGFRDPIGVWHNEIVEGHGRYLASKQIGLKEVPIIRLDDMTDEERKAYMLAHNKLTMNSDFDTVLLDMELADIETIDMGLLGFGDPKNDYLDNFNEGKEDKMGNLAKRFIVPPFSILDGRKGEWQDRKRNWNALIGDTAQVRQNDGAFDTMYLGMKNNVSILDAVLCEVVLKWFAPEKAKCFDVFAGDTVFGFVSSYLGHKFTGIELRKEQADFNNGRVQGMDAKYICDDGRNVLQHIPEKSQDLFFSCPPYFDLEVYSDLPNDASNQKTYKEFYAILDTAFANAIKALKNDRFAVVVCGDVRNKNGAYYNFPTDIKNTFINNGMHLYNEIILIDPVGTGAIRANKNMLSRKVVKMHQNVLVFYKGDPTKIKTSKAFPKLEFEVEDGSED